MNGWMFVIVCRYCGVVEIQQSWASNTSHLCIKYGANESWLRKSTWSVACSSMLDDGGKYIELSIVCIDCVWLE